MEKIDDKDKELVCRPCGKFLDSDELEYGQCPECETDEGVFMNDIISTTECPSNELYTLQHPVGLFRYFLRKTYSDIEMTNEACDEIGEGFYKYLRALNLTEDQKKIILPKNTLDVLFSADHPLKSKGFPYAYVIHFYEYVEITHAQQP